MKISTLSPHSLSLAITGLDGSALLSVKYEDREKKLVVTSQSVVMTGERRKRDKIQWGSKMFVGAATKLVDGAPPKLRITYARNEE